MPVHQIYALKYAGPVTSSGAFLMWQCDWDVTARRNYYFWCLTGGPEPVVIDTGMSPDGAEARNLPNYVSPAEMLARLGVEAGRVKHVILTHLHFDHAGGIDLFPGAKVYCQRAEYDFWLHDPIARRPMFSFFLDQTTRDSLVSLHDSGRLELIDGDAEVFSGVQCLLAPGHSPGLQAVAVETGRGTAVLGSDSGHVFQNFRDNWPSSLAVDQIALLKTFDKLKAHASETDLLFPGHDVLLAENFPQKAEGVTRLV